MSMTLNMTSKPEVLTVSNRVPDPELIERAALLLRDGGLVVAPTETRYGLLARADDPGAVARLYDAKNRPLTMPTAIFIGSVAAIPHFGEFTSTAKLLAGKLLPGPLTLVLKAVVDWSSPVVVDSMIGVRISSAPVIAMLLQKTGFPLTATSANVSGGGDMGEIEEIASALGRRINLYLDCGRLSTLLSTVVDCSGDTVRVLREGAISESRINYILKDASG